MTALKELLSVDEWNEVLEKSKEEPILVLKHSTTCPISTGAFSRVEGFETEYPEVFLKST